MRYKITIDDVLKSKAGSLNQHLAIAPKKKKKPEKARNDCPQVVAMHWWLKYWCEEKGFEFRKELQFNKKPKIKRPRRKKGEPKPPKEPPARRFRFDFAVIAPTWKAGLEYHGLNSEKSGHTTNKGFTSDTEKSNLAISEGWKVLSYTYLTYQNVLQDLEKLIING